ncbi:MAG: radical SAM protein [Methanomicrobiales archaeon]|nr:radical SAM protein [Methanomicrobiales archaeon]
MPYRHLFGPVASRRLGFSLGVDLLPFKTCTFNCVYCECGPTTSLTLNRREYIRAEDVIPELEDLLAHPPYMDRITFSGSGEPTLSTAIGKVLEYLDVQHPQYPAAVLTNGSLLWQQRVREEISRADLVLPTLTTVNAETFRRIHRPHPALSLEKILEGLVLFRREFGGEIWLEVFLVPPLNTSREELEGLQSAIARISPDRVQLNTLDRPCAEAWVHPASMDEMAEAKSILDFEPIDILTRATRPHRAERASCAGDTIRETLLRRPCTIEDLVRITGLHEGEVAKLLDGLCDEGVVEARSVGDGVFYCLRERRTEKPR